MTNSRGRSPRIHIRFDLRAPAPRGLDLLFDLNKLTINKPNLHSININLPIKVENDSPWISELKRNLHSTWYCWGRCAFTNTIWFKSKMLGYEGMRSSPRQNGTRERSFVVSLPSPACWSGSAGCCFSLMIAVDLSWQRTNITIKWTHQNEIDINTLPYVKYYISAWRQKAIAVPVLCCPATKTPKIV